MPENFMQRTFRSFANMVGAAVAGYLDTEAVEKMTKQKQYYEGTQKAPLKTKTGQASDNLITNYIGLAVDRSTSMLFGGGVEFAAAAGAGSPEQAYLDAVWAANKKEILLHRTGLDGELFGTPYIKISPNIYQLPTEEGGAEVLLPRLILVDPRLMVVNTDPMDVERVLSYVFEIKLSDDHAFREVTRRAEADERQLDPASGLGEVIEPGSWLVETFEATGRNSEWTLTSQTVWPYSFPPIIHWQNLPSVHSAYGMSGIEGVLEIQDKHNFVTSNMLKILRYHAHPKTWARGLPPNASLEKISWGGDEMLKATSETAEISNLEMQSDLASSRNIAQDFRQTIFDLCRVVDITTVTDKVGALTNFGLRVLYSDTLSKNSTRRLLYGDALEEINRRVLILAGFANVESSVIWGPDLPQDEAEDAKLILEDLAAGIASKQTASEARGYDWKTDPQNPEDLGEEDLIRNEAAATGTTEALALSRLFAGTTTP